MLVVVLCAPLMFLRDFTPDNELRYLSIETSTLLVALDALT